MWGLNEFSDLTPSLQFTIEEKSENKINFQIWLFGKVKITFLENQQQQCM